MSYIAECPKCSKDFEIPGPTTAEAGLQCPSCQHQFTPEKIHKVEDEPERAKAVASNVNLRLQMERINKVDEIANYFMVLASAAIIIALLLIVLAAVSKVGDDKWGDGPVWAGILFSVALIAYFFSQLLRIRIALETIAAKE